MYPDELCYLIVTAATDLFGQVRQLALDPANTADGNNDKCWQCGNAPERWQDLYCCQGCPDCYHFRCIPNGPEAGRGRKASVVLRQARLPESEGTPREWRDDCCGGASGGRSAAAAGGRW